MTRTRHVQALACVGAALVGLAGWGAGWSCSAVEGPPGVDAADPREPGTSSTSAPTTVVGPTSTSEPPTVPPTSPAGGTDTLVPTTVEPEGPEDPGAPPPPPLPPPLPPPSPEIAEPEYTWSLPFGDKTVSLTEDGVYKSLQAGHCAEAQDGINWGWRYFRGPRAVLLYQAGIDLCSGDSASARRWFDTAEADYGWTGIGDMYLDCNVYRAAASVLFQKAPESFTCWDGVTNRWSTDDPDARDDPRVSP